MSSGWVRACISNVLQEAPSSFRRTDRMKQLGESILAKSVERGEVFDEFCLKLVDFLQQEITSVCKRLKCHSSKRSKLWSTFHEHRTDPKGCLVLLWGKMLKDLGVECSTITESRAGASHDTDTSEDPLLMQIVFRKVFEGCMTEYFLKEKGASDSSTQAAVPKGVVELSVEVMNALRFACGFVPYA